MKIIEARAGHVMGYPTPAVGTQFNNGYYWEIPTDYHNAIKIEELAQDMVGQDIDGIVAFFGEYQEMAIVCREGKSFGTSFGAAFMARKMTGGSDEK
jgi:hypothetical protein